MAITQAPLLSLRASGTVGKTLTYGKWKGRNYARGYAVPSKKQTIDQVQTQTIFKWLSAVWLVSPVLFKTPWEDFARNKPVYGKNVWMGKNIEILRAESDINSWLGCPGLNYGPGLKPIVPFSSGINMSVVMLIPDAPDGWSFDAKVGAVIQTQNPQTDALHTATAAEQLNPVLNISIGPLTVGVEYAVSAWMRWTRADGSVAYSRAVNAVHTL